MENKIILPRVNPKRTLSLVLTAATAAASMGHKICQELPDRPIGSHREERPYLGSVLREAIMRRDYGLLPKHFNDVERLNRILPHLAIERGKDMHLQMGLMVLGSALKMFSANDHVPCGLEHAVVRKTMATAQFHICELLSLKELQSREASVLMEGIINTAYAQSLKCNVYLMSAIDRLARGSIKDINLLPEYRHSPSLIYGCSKAIMKGLITACVTLEGLGYPTEPVSEVKFGFVTYSGDPQTPFRTPDCTVRMTFKIA